MQTHITHTDTNTIHTGTYIYRTHTNTTHTIHTLNTHTVHVYTKQKYTHTSATVKRKEAVNLKEQGREKAWEGLQGRKKRRE